MKFLAALMLSAAALAPATAFAAAPVAAPAADTNLDKLVALMAPEDSIGRLAGKAFDAGMDQQVAADPKMKATFDANPGLRDQVGGQLRTQFTDILVAALPSLRTEISGILQQELTATEIADTLTFFASPTGQKLRAEVYETMGGAPGQSPQEIQQAAIAAVMAKMTADDYPALMAFGASPAAQKMSTINPKIQAASQAWATKLVEANRPKMQALAVKLTSEYLAKKGAK
ncbi:DUF2059 domain-containing protein [Sphingomonas sp. R-74633]|uniref:DUF2059 domain-containing protein n=1 Tax=Sphingomonas sp. R-74633 TaxID=2751188 RepID=UPI0015D10231|nr:DUF2059 domain-containing protein [Sphingomonas sp. R-74633]NYT42344.1 DUF2059 domain-containing protein [Sphingomonas sp. R-74633]